MRVTWGEMKKLWNWKMLAVIGVVCLMFYIMFMSYYVEYYKKGNHPQAELITYAEQLARRYGTSVTPEQLADFIAGERTPLIAEAESHIQTMPIFAEAGIYSFDDYITIKEERWERESTQAEIDAVWTLLSEECDYVGFKWEALEHYERNYVYSPNTHENPDSFYHVLNERERQRFDESVANGEYRAILSYWTYSNTNDYVMFFSVLLMLSVLILVSPLLVSDRNGNVHHLQYSSKLGRKVVYRQFAATLLSAFALTTLLMLIFGAVYSVNGTQLFWNNNLNSDFNIGIYMVFSLTYGEWVMTMVALMYILALGVSALAFILSRFSRNMITLVMKLIPIFAAMAYLSVSVFNQLFTIHYNQLYQLFRVFGTEAYVCGVFAVIALAAALFVIHREKRVDVM